ncbi:hypothetical protein [Pseudonocardia sp. NPDC049154]
MSTADPVAPAPHADMLVGQASTSVARARSVAVTLQPAEQAG